jgi:hypothetical protein
VAQQESESFSFPRGCMSNEMSKAGSNGAMVGTQDRP